MKKESKPKVEYRMDRETAEILARIEERLNRIEKDISEIKGEQGQVDNNKSEIALLRERCQGYSDRIEKIETGIGRVTWLVVSTVILAGLYLIIK